MTFPPEPSPSPSLNPPLGKAKTVEELINLLLELVKTKKISSKYEWHGWDDGSLILTKGWIASTFYDD